MNFFNLSLRFIAGAAICGCLFSACTSSKNIAYFQDIPVARSENLDTATEHSIRPNDILTIKVSSLSPEMDNIINTMSVQGNAGGEVPGYLVNRDGLIDIPFAGTLKVGGLTPAIAKEEVRKALMPSLNQPAVNLRVANFKVSVLGEVNKPGTYTIPSEKVSLLEALSLAGDLTITARRDNVLIIREQDTSRVYHRVDLRKSEIFQSPFYYLRSNDVIYVEPAKAKIAQNDTRKWQVLTFVATTLSLITVIITRAKF